MQSDKTQKARRVVLYMTIAQDVKSWLQARADKHHISLTAEINMILAEHMAKEGDERTRG